ncbi:hypothetical protein SDRG_11821, partial [Saprolegnia diclina VS20]
YDRAAAQYFRAVLNASDRVAEATQTISDWADAGTAPMVNDIAQLYPANVNILCSKVAGEAPNRLVAVRTCWAKSSPSTGGSFMVAGPPANCTGALTTTCDASQPLDLAAYQLF